MAPALPLFSRWRYSESSAAAKRLLQLLLGAELIGVAALLLAAVPKARKVTGIVTSRDTAKIKGCQISMVFFISTMVFNEVKSKI